MTTTTTEPATDWRDHNDRDAHQDRLATEPAAGRDQWGRQGAPLRGPPSYIPPTDEGRLP